MCGILGIFSHKPVAQEMYDGLIHLQHRGTDAAGILTYNERFHIKKGSGYVRSVFHQGNMSRLKGNIGIGHNRYSTVGNAHSVENAQPMYNNIPFGIGMCFNGNLTNYPELKEELKNEHINCNSDSDLEAIMGIFAWTLERENGTNNFFTSICKAVEEVYRRCNGGYSVIGLIAGRGMVVFRDPHGIRPMVMGKRESQGLDVKGKKSIDYIFSSENTMYYPLGFEFVGDVLPGEVVYISPDGKMHRKVVLQKEFTPCVFEYVYLARPDSYFNNISVYRARLRMGENLSKKWLRLYPEITPDILIPVPFSSNTAALSMAYHLGVRYSEGLYKNNFIGRTFIMPGQEKRRKSVRHKLSPQEIEIKDKDVMLLDDSIVRGTTSQEVVKLVRDAGARKVYFVSACPPIRYPDFYGIDIPTRKELIAYNKSVNEIRDHIGANIMMYQDIGDLVEAVTRRGEHNIDRLSMPCLDGWYVTGDIDEKRMEELEGIRSPNRDETSQHIDFGS
jgi:amidophosphoribosyltransferase